MATSWIDSFTSTRRFNNGKAELNWQTEAWDERQRNRFRIGITCGTAAIAFVGCERAVKQYSERVDRDRESQFHVTRIALNKGTWDSETQDDNEFAICETEGFAVCESRLSASQDGGQDRLVSRGFRCAILCDISLVSSLEF